MTKRKHDSEYHLIVNYSVLTKSSGAQTQATTTTGASSTIDHFSGGRLSHVQRYRGHASRFTGRRSSPPSHVPQIVMRSRGQALVWRLMLLLLARMMVIECVMICRRITAATTSTTNWQVLLRMMMMQNGTCGQGTIWQGKWRTIGPQVIARWSVRGGKSTGTCEVMMQCEKK